MSASQVLKKANNILLGFAVNPNRDDHEPWWHGHSAMGEVIVGVEKLDHTCTGHHWSHLHEWSVFLD